MKNKGISLIVLIITCVVIIILATAIIVNIAQTNMIENAKEAVVKQDFAAMQDELSLYIADKYADALGKYNPEELNVIEEDKVVEILKSIKGTKYADFVIIENGKIAITDQVPEDIKELVNEILNTNSTTHVTHTYGEWEIVVESTATTEGKKKKVCTVCGDEITVVTSKLGEIAKWNYEVDEENGKVILSKYNGIDTDVTVYGYYEIDGKMYQTAIASNYYDVDTGAYVISDYMFSSNTKVETVTFNKGIDMSENIGLAKTFYSCTALKSVNFTNLDTSNVITIRGIFQNCTSLKSIDLTGLDTSKVATMRGMFYECTSLENIDMTGLDTSNVTTMENMFYKCTSLKSVNLTGIDTSKVTTMQSMFNNCTSLESIDLTGLDTSKVTTMQNMFYNCTSLKSANLSNLDTSKVTTMRGMFSTCTSITNIDLTNFKTQSVTDMVHMFYDLDVLEKLDLSSFDTSNVTDMESMFCGCLKLTELKLSEKFNTSKVEKMTRMFCYCSSIPELDLTSFDTRNTTLMNYLFEFCSNLKTIYVTEGKWSTSQADTYKIFSGCGTSKVTYK